MQIFFTILIILFFSSFSRAQSNEYEDIFKTNTVYFYGYDFSRFKFVEPARIGQGEKIKGVIFELIAILDDKRPEGNYRGMFKKDTVIFDRETVNQLNANIDPNKILDSYSRHSIPKDSLQNFINQYYTEGKSGIGFVQIIECFYKPKKQTSIWFVFFDIATKRILDAYETINNDADSYHGLAEYWMVGVRSGMSHYLSDHYKPELKKHKRKM